MSLPLMEIVSGILKPAAELVDDLHTSDEERLAAKTRLLEVSTSIMAAALDYEEKALTARASIVEAEARSEHWLTATWRPITMLTMLLLVLLDSLALLPNALSADAWMLLKIGLGGYVVGRSAEKVVKEIKK